MSKQNPQQPLLVNASRVVPVGGLHAFTDAVLRSLAGRNTGVAAIVGPETQVPAGIERIEAPSMITMQREISLLRSIYGFLYSILLSWRYRRRRMLATTLLGFPLHRNQVITLHDIRPLRMPYTWAQRWYYRYVMPYALRSVKGVLTVSETSRREILAAYPMAAGKIFVVPNVIRTLPPAEIPSRPAGEPAYLLMVNASYRHKNAVELLEQHALWSPRYRLKILAGGGSHEKELRAQVERFGLAGQVDFLPVASEQDLAALYVHAAALVFPSLMEGFGMPTLEAMGSRTPAIVSDIPVFREVMREGPIFVELGSTESWRRAFAVLESQSVQGHVAKGRAIAAEYTQQRMDEKLQAALDAIWRPGAEGEARPPRVLIDTTTVTRQKAGVGVYVKNLIDHLVELPAAAHYFILVQSDDPDFVHDGRPNVTMLRVPATLYRIRPLRIVLEQVWLPVIVLWHRIDVAHSVHYSFPLISPRAKRVVTIHDMTFVTMPEVHQSSKLPYFRFFIKAATQRAEKLIFVSRSSLRDCGRLFPLESERAEVIHLGLDDVWYQEASAAGTLPPGVPEKYILFVGTIEPRKNIARLIAAFSAMAKEYPEYALVIAGKRGWKCEDVFVAARASGVEDRILFTGFVSEEHKVSLMRQAAVFVYPTLYEGFGIPVLEAMACGVPTLSSNVSSIPEIAGDAALLVNPESAEEIEQGLRTLVCDERLRACLREKGMARARLFPWKATAERTLAVYESLCSPSRP